MDQFEELDVAVRGTRHSSREEKTHTTITEINMILDQSISHFALLNDGFFIQRERRMEWLNHLQPSIC